MKAAFYGSSTVAGAGLNSQEQRFSSLLVKDRGWDEVNLGVANSVVTGRDLDAQIISQQSGVVRVPDIFDADPDLVFVLYGFDDVQAEKPVGALSDFRPGTFASDYDSMVRGIAGGCDPGKIVLATLEFLETDGTEGPAKACNEAIRQVSSRYQIRLFDTAERMRSQATLFRAPGDAPYSLSAEAHAALAVELGRFLSDPQ